MKGNYYVIRFKNGSTIHALHKNRRWSIKAKNRQPRQSCNNSISTWSMKSDLSLSHLCHSQLGHVLMRRIKKLFKKNTEYDLPHMNYSSEVTCEDCMQCKSTRRQVLGSTNCEPRLMDIIVTDVLGLFTPCVTGEKLIVTF